MSSPGQPPNGDVTHDHGLEKDINKAYEKVEPPSYWETKHHPAPASNVDDGVPIEIPVEMPDPLENSHEQHTQTSFREDSCISDLQRGVAGFFSRNAGKIKTFILFTVFVCYTVYFAFAIKASVKGATVLIVITSLVVFFYIYNMIKKKFGARMYKSFFGPIERWLKKNWPCYKWLLVPAIIIVAILYIAIGVIQDIQQLQSLSGFVVFITYLWLCSKFPTRILWQPVIFGFGLQFVMGILVLRTSWGFNAVKWLSNEITTFINYALEGAALVFGDPMLLLHPFVFTVMPMLVYIGAVMSILYYLGITQAVAAKIGWFVQVTMGTTAIESLGVGANIFLNGMDTMLMLRHYLHKLTASEFHCFLVGNHSTVAGFAFATFVMFGAPPQHLLSAAVMSAPAAIAVCKLNFPETEESITKTQADVQLEKGEETNVIEAGANGAAVAGKTVVAVVVSYIGFMSILAFINATLSWFGGRVGYPELSFEIICSYLFFPLSMVMGIEIGECQEVAKLVGLKVFTSEMLAYQELGVSISKGLISARSASIATYALCGFSSLSTLAIAVGVWNTICPVKTHEMTSQLARVIINANISCFMTACVAGLMYDPNMDHETPGSGFINMLLGFLPGYKTIWNLLPGI